MNMTPLRRQLNLARTAHLQDRYPGDLAAELGALRRAQVEARRSRWALSLTFGAGAIAAAVATLLVVARSTGPMPVGSPGLANPGASTGGVAMATPGAHSPSGAAPKRQSAAAKGLDDAFTPPPVLRFTPAVLSFTLAIPEMSKLPEMPSLPSMPTAPPEMHGLPSLSEMPSVPWSLFDDAPAGTAPHPTTRNIGDPKESA